MYEILLSIQKVINHDDKLQKIKFQDLPEEIFDKYDSATFKLPYFNKNVFMEYKKGVQDKKGSKMADSTSNTSCIIKQNKLKLKEIPTGLNVSEYASFFNECLIDSVCSDHAEKYTSDLTKNVQKGGSDRNCLYFDDMTCYFLEDDVEDNSSSTSRRKIFNRSDIKISGLINANFENLLALAINKKAEKSLSYSFKLVSNSGKNERNEKNEKVYYLNLISPEPSILYDGQDAENCQIVFRVEIFRHLKEVSDAINCGCGGDLEELMDEVERRKPFCYIRLG